MAAGVSARLPSTTTAAAAAAAARLAQWPTRSLATATHMPLDANMGAYNPFGHVTWAGQSQLPSWDGRKPLVIHDHVTSAPSMRDTYGLGTNPLELQQNLYACLRVGRMERATAMLDRMVLLYVATAPELVNAHNAYLQALLEQALADPRPEAMARLTHWHRRRMAERGIPPDAQTFVTLIRAAMAFLDGEHQRTEVLALLSLAQAQGPTVIDQINAAPDFTEAEWDVLIRLQPDNFDAPPPVDAIQAITHTGVHADTARLEHGLPLPDVPSSAPAPAPIAPVAQKGYGLEALKRALASLEAAKGVPYPHDLSGSPRERAFAHAYARQLRIEQDAAGAAVARWRHEEDQMQRNGIHGVLQSKPIQALMYKWYEAILPPIRQRIAHATDAMAANVKDKAYQRDESVLYAPWLERCAPEKLAAMTVARVINSCLRGHRDDPASLKISALSSALGSDVQEDLNAELKARHEAWVRKVRRMTRLQLIDKLTKSSSAKSSGTTTPAVSSGTTPSAVSSAKKRSRRSPATPSATLATSLTSSPATLLPAPSPLDPDSVLSYPEKADIPMSSRVKLGAMLLELLLQAATLTVTAQDPVTGNEVSTTTTAFYHQVGFHQGKRVGYVVPHHELLKKLRTDPMQNIATMKLPMVVPPRKWTSFEDGGYYTTPGKFVRQKQSDLAQRAYAQTAIANGDMDQILTGLDVLGKIPWKINMPILHVMTEAWNQGKALAGLVAEDPNLKPPVEPPADADFKERLNWSKKLQAYENERLGLHSQRCYQNFVLETARAYANEEKIYFPHSVDFRGRAYPIPPILNHMGADVSRGLLKFANGKELGATGLRWLKIHLANLAGFDKASLREREQFAIDMMDEIRDSATNPLNGRQWWVKAEDPWQCLACCMELKDAHDLPDPTRFVSHLPVHQDGTCNGLQHYAALGGDHAGARQVNLEPSDRPQDIYTGVAEAVKEEVALDAAAGVPAAQFVNGHISRKVVKRTVMTNVYGVTFMGAKEQVLDELKAIFPNFEPTQKIPSLQSVALYIAAKIFVALGQIFNGAQEIQYWLGECGDRITTSVSPDQISRLVAQLDGDYGQLTDPKYKIKKLNASMKRRLKQKGERFKTSIIWTTPLRMPIVQPYRKDSTQVIKTKIQDITVRRRSTEDEVDKRKQLQAFPPNFVHSLDATHMILSALKCSESGLDFSAVHDSFWTHACDIPNLNVILRDAFVRMHSENIIDRLAAEFAARYAGAMYRASIYATATISRKITQWRAEQRGVPDSSTASSKQPTRRGVASFDELALEGKRQQLLNSKDPAERKIGEEMVTPTSIWLANPEPDQIHSLRLSLLGETKSKASSIPTDDIHDTVCTDEAEAMAKDAAMSPSPDVAYTLEATQNAQDDLDAEPASSTKKVKKSSSKLARERSTIQVWIPLSFPPVPQRGTWDVARLRDSEYFFS